MALTWQTTIAFDSPFTETIWGIAASSDTVFVWTGDNQITPVGFDGVKGTPFTPEKREATDTWKGIDTTETGNLVIAFNAAALTGGWREFETDGTYVSQVYSFRVFGGFQREAIRGLCRHTTDRTQYFVQETDTTHRLRRYSVSGSGVANTSIQSGSGVTGLASSAAELWALRAGVLIENYDANLAFVDTVALPAGVTVLSGIAYDGTGVFVADSDNLYYSDEVAVAEDVVEPEAAALIRQLHLHDTSSLIARMDVVKGDAGHAPDTIKHVNIAALINTSSELSELVVSGFAAVDIFQVLNIAEITPTHILPNLAKGDKVFFHTGAADAPPAIIPEQYWEIKGVQNTGNKRQQTLICQSNEIVI